MISATMKPGMASKLPGLSRWAAVWLLALLLGWLGGCAAVPGEGDNRADPWESFNRHTFAFNEAMDRAVIKPAAQVYQAVVPSVARTGVNNFFGNLGDLWTSANLLLQVKPQAALEMGMRAGINTLFGLGGALEVAEDLGLARIASEDFGQTLGYWGLGSGPYLVLPLLGPSTLRDATGLVLDLKDSPSSRLWQEPRDKNPANLLQVLNARVKLLNVSQLLDDIALDKYVLLRDAFLARRKSLIYDGEPPDGDAAPAPYKSLLK